MNPKDYSSFMGCCYLWSVTRLFRIVNLFYSLYAGRTILQRDCQELRALEDSQTTAKGGERSIDALPDSQNRPFHAPKSQLAFRIEVTLAYSASTQRELYMILASDNANVADLARKIFYKTYYEASKNHGQQHMDSLVACMSHIHATHVAIRNLIRRCEDRVDWTRHGSSLTSISTNLHIRGAPEKGGPSKVWQQIGFQGDDPCTDFRSVGELGLHNLEYFCAHHPLYAIRMIAESGTAAVSQEDLPWYPFALCAIHVTKLLCSFIETGLLQRHLLQAQYGGESGVQDFTDALFSFLFVSCHLDWAEGVDKREITSVLQFELFFLEFGTFMRRELRSKSWKNEDFHPRQKWW